MEKQPVSLKWGLMTTIVLCWVVPVLIVVAVAGLLLSDSYRRSVQQEISTGAESAVQQVQTHLSDAIVSSKAVSYDGVVQEKYRDYLDTGDHTELYRAVSDYLSLSFGWKDHLKAVFVEFPQAAPEIHPSFVRSCVESYALLNQYRTCSQEIRDRLSTTDTGIFFLVLDGELYMARNLLDEHFDTFATLVMLLDCEALFRPLESLPLVQERIIRLDDCCFRLENGSISPCTPEPGPEAPETPTIEFSAQVDTHTFSFTADEVQFHLWEDAPQIRWAVAGVTLLVLPLLAVVIFLFYRHVTRPMEVLAQANHRVEGGERGYQIEETPANMEFLKLFSNFNAMSAELKNQFERAHLEQQATQRAKIKALQSQINPHFLNNTLEIINWEARLAENDRVCAMIEALSTMLDAALDRDGRSQIPLREELSYVDAYLYIIRERLGEGFHVQKEIDPATLDQPVPMLVLQPIVENAVEHDITPNRGGGLCLRSFRTQSRMVLEVIHDGVISARDQEKIRGLLSEPAGEFQPGSQVGLQNVHQRLRLIYGGAGSLTIAQTAPGTVVARVEFPILPVPGKDSKDGQERTMESIMQSAGVVYNVSSDIGEMSQN